jgi:hypothetical protein
MPFKRQEDLDRLREALRKAGLPEKSAKGWDLGPLGRMSEGLP